MIRPRAESRSDADRIEYGTDGTMPWLHASMSVAVVHLHRKVSLDAAHVDGHAVVASPELQRNTGVADPKAFEFDALEEWWQHGSFDSKAALERVGNEAKDRLEQVRDGSRSPRLRVTCQWVAHRRAKGRSGKPGECLR